MVLKEKVKRKKKEKIKRWEEFQSLKEIVIPFDVLRVWKSVMPLFSMPKSCHEHQMKRMMMKEKTESEKEGGRCLQKN